MWQETTRKEHNRRIFEEELDGFLPGRIFDVHVHAWCEGVVPGDGTYSCGGHPIRHYTLDELRQDLADVFPGRECGAICFGMPHVGYDHRLNNEYLARSCDNRDFFALRLLDPHEDDAETLYRELKDGGFIGVKPYPDYSRKPNLHDATIDDMLPAWALDVVNELGLMVMLHIPRKERLADPLNQVDVPRLCRRYPNARIVLAHIGRAYYLKNIVGQVDELAKLPNLYYDIAMLNHWEVLEYAFTHLPNDRLLYGSDIPIALAPGKSVEINDQYTYVTPVPWSLSISDDHGKIAFTSFLYEELRAVKKAVQRAGKHDAFVEAFFLDNSQALLGHVTKGTVMSRR